MQTITFRMQGNEVLLWSTGKYVLSLGEEQDGKVFLKVCVCVCVCVYETGSLCSAAEIDTTL